MTSTGQSACRHHYKERPVAVVEISDIYQPDKRVEARKSTASTIPPPGVRRHVRAGRILHRRPRPCPRSRHSTWKEARAKYYLSSQRDPRIFPPTGLAEHRRLSDPQSRPPGPRVPAQVRPRTCRWPLVHPLAGATKEDDIDVATRSPVTKAHRKLLPGRANALAAFPASMRYAGPREAVFHALCRKNYGCTHMIVGPGPRGVGELLRHL